MNYDISKAQDDNETIHTHIERYLQAFEMYKNLYDHNCDAEEGFREYAAYILKRVYNER